MRLCRIGFSNFRSFGDEPCWIDPFKRANIIIGTNNSGKSNVLEFVRAIEPLRSGSFPVAPNNLALEIGHNRHRLDGTRPFRLHVAAETDDRDRQFFLGLGAEVEFSFEVIDKHFQCVAHPFDRFDPPTFWRGYQKHTGTSQGSLPTNPNTLENHKKTFCTNLTKTFLGRLPGPVLMIPQFRQIKRPKSSARSPGQFEFDGEAIVETLAEWQHPSSNRNTDRDKFSRIQELLRRLLHLPDAELEVSHDLKVMVTSGSVRLPLERYGTGVHELIILAIAVCSQTESVFCIEEPEIHLHPRLQREFLEFLLSETDNYYLLTTHSNAFLQLDGRIQITHLRLECGATSSDSVQDPEGALRVLEDLGIRASDLLQSNCIIWVEGPSDRIYVNRWLNLNGPDLREGIEYSVMFYGGGLRSHLSLGRSQFPSPDDLIPLLRINQRAILMMDSDRENKHSKLNKNKLRMKKECEDSSSLCWVTWGRTVENYLSGRTLSEAYSAKLSKKPKTIPELSQFEKIEERLVGSFKGVVKRASYYDDDKVGNARLIAQFIRQDDQPGDLKKQMKRVVEFIRECNS